MWRGRHVGWPGLAVCRGRPWLRRPFEELALDPSSFLKGGPVDHHHVGLGWERHEDRFPIRRDGALVRLSRGLQTMAYLSRHGIELVDGRVARAREDDRVSLRRGPAVHGHDEH